MKTAFLLIVTTLTAGTNFSRGLRDNFNWPENKKAAVCLTFDDGLDSHLDNAIPLLDAYGFKATFFCTGNSGSLHRRTDEWKRIVENGHELGNHTLFHPCDGRSYEWVKPEYDLNSYTVDQIRTELFTANTLLKAVDGKDHRTYGYTCSNYRVRGDSSFVAVVEQLFSAARNDGPVPGTMANIDIHLMPSWCVDNHTGRELIEYVEQAGKKGTIATFMFHSVGGGYLNVSTEALKELLVYLKSHEQDYWVDTFDRVTQYISGQQVR
ncbi:MAG: chitooligosaccharide deacetylase [Bacteroidetes bacterium]|nr:MAG: chitooligosaccharide deacetylase [Bacteroidota bacterium]